MSKDIVLEVSKLTKKYGDFTSVKNLSLKVLRGEIFGLLGHNGAGKSSTIECILGTKKFEEGKVVLLNMNPIKNRKKLFERVGVQFQQSNYQDKIKVKEICEMTASLYVNPVNYESILKDFKLYDKRNNFVSDLSGGQKQKLSVLLALIPKPEIVFLDELTTGLDTKARREIWGYLKKLKSKGISIFLTSHYMDEVEYLCDRICILKEGNMVICDTVQNVIKISGKERLEDAYLYYTGEEELE
ncbi:MULTISPECIES: ABC transporter ATP-binding protein [Clostridium]|uniref:ABC transporter ATP-binding protein n=1 Tax=Clostridium TaxID=1485 RepID=UPI00069F1EAA|nr:MULTISPECIES: ABC transporter ATP-binding protein [Clostridium]KOF57659.1 ABC transporter [Clostridium sp. DMHC 10]MCD2347575.1 ABC transporter ATP-binding protein [Clostridium guangxiense]